MAKRKGLAARAVDGRIDRSILGDVAILVGLAVFAGGLWQLSEPVAYLFAGGSIVGGTVVALLPAKVTKGSGKGDA